MVYSIQIARIGRRGVPVEPATELTAPSEREAIATLRRSIEQARTKTQPMRFSLYGPDDRLVLSYTSEAEAAPFPDAPARTDSDPQLPVLRRTSPRA